MKCVDELVNSANFPLLIPTFKKPERRLLSVFMTLLDLVPELRGAFLKRCEFKSGATSNYKSFMEPHYDSPKLTRTIPDGLVVAKRGSSVWAAFIEAKVNDSKIKPKQIEDQCTLASELGIPVVISISNEFAKHPKELPYPLSVSKRRKREVFHFAWAELRTFISVFLSENTKISDTEQKLIEQTLKYFESASSGVENYDAMPKDWAKFVESSGTALGFGSNTGGITEIVHGWQQERRDLHSKLILETRMKVILLHSAGVRANADERLKKDRLELSGDYTLSAEYQFTDSKARLHILADLRANKMSAALQMTPPENKKAKATISWLQSKLDELNISGLTISIEWRGRGGNSSSPADEIMKHADVICGDQKEAPKSIRLIREIHDVRRFKSRTRFIEDLEKLAVNITLEAKSVGFI